MNLSGIMGSEDAAPVISDATPSQPDAAFLATHRDSFTDHYRLDDVTGLHVHNYDLSQAGDLKDHLTRQIPSQLTEAHGSAFAIAAS